MQRQIGTSMFLLIFAILLVACAPMTATPVAQQASTLAPTVKVQPTMTVVAVETSEGAGVVEPTLAPTVGPVSTAATPAGVTGKLFAGTVRHAGQPVANARVELREIGWATNRTPAVATVQADAEGAFSLANPPVGEFSVIGVFPDGEIDAGGWPPVTIAPDQEITGFLVPLERLVTLLSPIAGAPAASSPNLRWQPVAGAARYRLWVIDAGTTQMMLDQTTTATRALVTTSLEPGRTYQWVVNALNEAGDIVATAANTFVVAGGPTSEPQPTTAPGTVVAGGATAETQATPAPGTAVNLPPTCQPGSELIAVYADLERGFCFLYPARFEQNAFDPGQIGIVGSILGPALDSSPDPLRATLLIEAVAAADADLKTAVESLIEEFEGQAGISIQQRPFDLGGVPAVLLEGVPGRGGSRDIVSIQNGQRFRMIFMPDPQGFPAVTEDLEELFDAVTQSFTFFMPVGGAASGSGQ